MSAAAPQRQAVSPRIEILVNAGLGETRAAQIENGILQDIHVQRDATASAVGNIYLGSVQRVLAGMQAAFVDVGLARAAFLQLADMVRPSDAATARSRIEQRLVSILPMMAESESQERRMATKGASQVELQVCTTSW